jgi:hypothetical protein
MRLKVPVVHDLKEWHLTSIASEQEGVTVKYIPMTTQGFPSVREVLKLFPS